MPGILKVGFLELPSKSLIFLTVYFSLIDILLPFTEKMTGAHGEEVRSANYFIKLLPCGPLLRTWESTYRKLTSISNTWFVFYILLVKYPTKNTCYRFKVDGQTSVNDSFSCCKIDWRMVLSKLRQFSASSPCEGKIDSASVGRLRFNIHLQILSI